MPTKIVVDCTTGKQTIEQLSPAEEQALATMQQAAAQEEAARQQALAQRQVDLAALKAYATTGAGSSDPMWAAVARLLGAM